MLRICLPRAVSLYSLPPCARSIPPSDRAMSPFSSQPCLHPPCPLPRGRLSTFSCGVHFPFSRSFSGVFTLMWVLPRCMPGNELSPGSTASIFPTSPCFCSLDAVSMNVPWFSLTASTQHIYHLGPSMLWHTSRSRSSLWLEKIPLCIYPC